MASGAVPENKADFGFLVLNDTVPFGAILTCLKDAAGLCSTADFYENVLCKAVICQKTMLWVQRGIL
jgi:hypothetical protein